MRDNWLDQSRLFLVHRIPLIMTLLLMFLFFMPISSAEVNYFRPAVGLICVYYWALNRGYLFGFFSAFLVGFVIDVYSSSPLGINILLLMILVAVANGLEKYVRVASFSINWLVFGLVGLGFILLKWLLLMIYFQSYLPLPEILLSFISTVMFYPLIAGINAWAAHNFLPQERINE